MRKVSKIIVLSVLIIILLLLLSGCLSTFYSPRIVEPNKWQIGVGINPVYGKGINWSRPDDSGPYGNAGAFVRYGIKYNYDIGLGLNAFLGPRISVRKQFNINNNFIDAVNCELGGGYSFISTHVFTGVNFLHENSGVSMKVGVINTISPFPTGAYPYGKLFDCSTYLSYEFGFTNFTLMPYINIGLERSISSDEPMNELFTGFEDESASDFISIGAGISVYWKL